MAAEKEPGQAKAQADLLRLTAEGVNDFVKTAADQPPELNLTPATEAVIGDALNDVGVGDPEIVRRSLAAATELVSCCRVLNAEGFRRLNNMIRVSANARAIDSEYVIMRHEHFGREKQADQMRGFRKFYADVVKITGLFIEAAMDEAGLNRLGVAFGGLEVGAMTLPARHVEDVVNKAIAFVGRKRDDASPAGAIAGANDLRTAVMNLNAFLDEANAGAVAPAMTDAAPMVDARTLQMFENVLMEIAALKPGEELSAESLVNAASDAVDRIKRMSMAMYSTLAAVAGVAEPSEKSPEEIMVAAAARFSDIQKQYEAQGDLIDSIRVRFASVIPEHASAAFDVFIDALATKVKLLDAPVDATLPGISKLIALLANIRREARQLKVAVFGDTRDDEFAGQYPALSAFITGTGSAASLQTSLDKLADITAKLEAKLNSNE